ncbi:uncharacterized protein [Parasteatoda tepidariorum]|uniref:uncharacterized protein n=1 Tax=Parasteatoda tepidariorum TaxID=114398 RepID=UPI001C717EA7|nr:uncharacterized protein LOC107448386 [Parasteatoda tepidariorum]
MKCVRDYMSYCMSNEKAALFNLAAGGRLKILEDLCTDGTEFNTVYLNNIDCWPKTKSDLEYCQSKFTDTLYKINYEVDLSLKSFHTCCGFEWLKMCTITSVELKCNQDAKGFMEKLTTISGGEEYRTLCGKSTEGPFTNCFGLYGEENLEKEDLVMIFSTGSTARIASFVVLFVPFILTKLNDYVTLY